MKKILLFPLAGFLLFNLTGCVPHLTQAQCLATNWRQVGFTDGSQGQPPRNLQSSIQDCLKFQIVVNPSVYMKGYRQGLKQYCTPGYGLGVTDGTNGKPLSEIMGRQGLCSSYQIPLILTQYKAGRSKGLLSFCTYSNGQVVGASGGAAPNVCPANLQAAFMRGWQSGQNQYCSNPGTGFALGKAGQPYPAICAGNRYYAFQSEYQRGQVVAIRISRLQARIDNIKSQIDSLVNQYGFNKNKGAYYSLGNDTSPPAQAALNQVNSLVSQKEYLRNQLFQAQATN